MIDGMPWPVGLGVTAAGWLLAALVLRSVVTRLMSGDLLTRREADEIMARAKKAEDTNEKLVDQNGQLMDAARLGMATLQALEKAAGDE